LIKCGTLGKIRHTWKNAVNLIKCGTFGKMRRTWKNTLHLEKYGTLAKNTLGNTLGKKQHTW